MASVKRLLLCFETSSEYMQLALDYWAGQEVAGRWTWEFTVEQLSLIHGVPKSAVPKIAKSAAQCVNMADRCKECGLPQGLSSRSAINGQVHEGYLCSTCTHVLWQSRLREAEEAKQLRRASQRAKIIEISQRYSPVSYDEVSYSDAVILFGIMLVSDEACEAGTFRNSEDLRLSASASLSDELLIRLFRSGVLHFDESTPLEAIEADNEGKWTFSLHRVNWRLAPDSAGRTFPEVMKHLGKIIDARQGDPRYGETVTDLWRLFAYDDVLQHLLKEVQTYRLPDVRVGPKTELALWHALEYFSIPQVRRQIGTVVKDAAAFSARRDFAQRHALNTIPGSLIRNVDRALSDGWQIYPLFRSWQEEPTLTTVLFNRVLGTGLPGFKTLSNSLLTSSFPKRDCVFNGPGQSLKEQKVSENADESSA